MLLASGVDATAQSIGADVFGKREPELGPIEPIVSKPSAGFVKPPQQADLGVSFLGLTDDGRVTYIVVNSGQSAANSRFVVDVFIAGLRGDTIKHEPLPPRSQQRVVSNLARPKTCAMSQFRIAVDTQSLVSEANEGNNVEQKTMLPKCADLVIDIDKDSVANGLKYRAKVKVTNNGNRTTEKEFTVMLAGSGGGLTGTTALPILENRRLGPLQPGQSESFYEGGDHLGTSSFSYHALADRFDEIREANEDNNQKWETMGGGH